MTIRAAIVEDNIENIRTLKHILDEADQPIEIVGEAQTIEEAYDLLKTPALDIAFLDIQLRKGTTFEVLEKLYQEHQQLPELVFVTAHGLFEYALKAIQFACLDFVTKPYDEDAIQAALQRYVQKLEKTKPDKHSQVGFLLELLRGDIKNPKSIAINLSKGIIEFADLGNILFFEADQNTSKVYLSDGTILYSTKPMGHYLDLLLGHPEFIQISKSCLVNTIHLKQYDHREKVLLLKNGTTLFASHRYSRKFKKQLLENQQNKRGFLGSFFDKKG